MIPIDTIVGYVKNIEKNATNDKQMEEKPKDGCTYRWYIQEGFLYIQIDASKNRFSYRYIDR